MAAAAAAAVAAAAAFLHYRRRRRRRVFPRSLGDANINNFRARSPFNQSSFFPTNTTTTRSGDTRVHNNNEIYPIIIMVRTM